MGGYQIIDVTGLAFVSGTKVTKEGVYDLVKGTDKVILLHGLQYKGTKQRDVWLNDLTKSGTNYTGTVFGNTILISNDDGITITDAQAG